MFSRLFSTETKPGAFFRRIDWTAFWGATLIAFLVYFFTLGPSVGLEDSGELATAADHLGVPHPPGYPFWSLCCWIFCRLFSWVTYMGQPTPAWAVSLFSAVAGAFAAGCTAMLICRSGSDMLDSLPQDEGNSPDTERTKKNALMSLAGGLGGSLVFAFSPVEWSQSTIVEIYSLNALFLMAVFLLSYRWMRKPSDKILWLTAFIFGLGLTNYQVLLLAAVPLAIIIALRNIRLFRDFMLILIPIGLTAKVLQIGCMLRANAQMSSDVINKFEPIVKQLPVDKALPYEAFPNPVYCPNEVVLWIGLVLVVLAPLVGAFLRTRGDLDRARKVLLVLGGGGAVILFLAATVFGGTTTWSGIHETAVAPLMLPGKYAALGAMLAAAFTAAIGSCFFADDARGQEQRKRFLIAAGALSVVAVIYAAGCSGFVYDASLRKVVSATNASPAGYTGPEFSWVKPTLLTIAGLIALFALALGTPNGLAYAIPVAAVQLAAFALLHKGAMNGLTNPHSWWFLWPIVWNFAVLALASVTLPNGRAAAIATFLAELGVSFYAYMPIVSDLRNPPMNWGYPRTWEGFKHAIMRGQYEQIKMPSLFNKAGFELFLKQLGFYFQDLRLQFTLVAAALALVPFSLWKLIVKREGNKPLVVNATGIAAILYVAVAVLVTIFSEILENATGGEVPLRLDKFLLLLLAISALVGLAAMAVRQTFVVYRMIVKDRETLPEGQAAKPIAGKLPAKVEFLADDVSQQWLIAVGACFALMSLFLVALAGVKGDIQDGFIQKVKFISSHGMFSLWIGYGLAVGLAFADTLLKRFIAAEGTRRLVFRLLCLAAACVALIPIYENYTNGKLVFAMGSAEQNGHTFGWQFGNYQLRGANAIREELSPDEEPLPNPQWPKEMEPHAIFFGGTDPGRFVPTYMIYSANVRPDVYLITQNALADDTYMSVERDLYGDEIWIPSKEDSAKSFEIYVSEVKSGKRSANADLKIENGRVQVTGALGVMEINGILTKMMFDHERLRHAFYVEESYVIQWMYPYLTPHGLIMKINANPNAMNADIVKNDMEFWDWYTRRLLRDPAFRRDFPAQKSFSKLRAAIAGLYSHSGIYSMADQAYREAVLLYPASPEATFRYIQEVQMPLRRWDAVTDLLDYTDRVDPNNTRTSQLRVYVRKLKDVGAKIEEFKAKAAKGPLSAIDSISLAQCYHSVGQDGKCVETVRKTLALPDADDEFDILYLAGHLLSSCSLRGDAANAMKRALAKMPANLDPRYRLELINILIEGGLTAEAEGALNEYLRIRPDDATAWMKMAIVKDTIGQTQNAQGAILQALKADRNTAANLISGSEQLQRIAAPLLQRNR